MKLSIIVAKADNHVIGKDNDLVWNLPDDMKYFTRTTRGHFVVMGRKNWDSIPDKYRPLPGRTNLVLTRNVDYNLHYRDTYVLHSLKEAMHMALKKGESELFIIGGEQIYKEAMPYTDRLYITEVHASPEGDTFFPEFDPNEWIERSRTPHLADERHAYSFDFVLYERR